MLRFYKIKIALLSIVIVFTVAKGRNQNPQSICPIADTVKINILDRITSSYFCTNPKEEIPYGENATIATSKINWEKGMDSGLELIICKEFTKNMVAKSGLKAKCE